MEAHGYGITMTTTNHVCLLIEWNHYMKFIVYTTKGKMVFSSEKNRKMFMWFLIIFVVGLS